MSLKLTRALLIGLTCSAIGVGGVLAQGTDSAPASATAKLDDYRLGAADKIRVLVYNEPNLSGEFIVNSGGTLSFPLIGDVPAAGRTTDEVRQDIETRLAAGYLRSPQVSIDVLEFRPYFILGEVNKPGDYPYTADLTVSKAVATANGFTYRADEHHVWLKHAGETKEQKYTITSDIPLQPGDTIRIGERYF
jgi:polysaccharide export outer membrane protein